MIASSSNPIRVLIVDDSPFVRRDLTKLLSEDPQIGVVFGMPRAAMLLGNAERMISLDALPQALLRRLERGPARVAAA